MNLPFKSLPVFLEGIMHSGFSSSLCCRRAVLLFCRCQGFLLLAPLAGEAAASPSLCCLGSCLPPVACNWSCAGGKKGSP